jgi:hypothetical protein
MTTMVDCLGWPPICMDDCETAMVACASGCAGDLVCVSGCNETWYQCQVGCLE